LSATVAADRAFPAAVTELSESLSPNRMIQLSDILPAGLGILISSVGLLHEFRWWYRHGHYTKTVGIVIHVVQDRGTRYPEIQYMHRGQGHKFVSRYSTYNLAVGQEVVVLVSPDGTQAVHLSMANRWVYTIGPLLVGFILLSILWERNSQ
jgi:hypothetical protein